MLAGSEGRLRFRDTARRTVRRFPFQRPASVLLALALSLPVLGEEERQLTGDEVDRVDSIANEIKNSAVYAVGRAVFKSTFSTHTAGAGLQKRLDKYRERLKNHQGVVKHVYCSELVILCYQLAWENDRHRLFIDLDGKHTWPSTLRRHLKNTIHWQHLGEFAPQ